MDANALSRRRLLAGLGVLGAAAAVPFACAGSAAPRTRKILGAGRAPGILQIVAHQDDDFLFMNPDLAVALDAGIPITTVYVTAGEASGAVDFSLTRGEFSANRQAGVRAAYAAMLHSPDDWKRETITLAGGQSAELATPTATDKVRLVFMNLPDGYDEQAVPLIENVPNGLAVSGLLLGLRSEIPTVMPDGSPITGTYSYTKESLITALAGFLRDERPTIVRTLDPNYAEQRWRGSQNDGGDNPDHTAVARFVDLAVQRHVSADPSARLLTANYVGYGISGLAANLSPQQSERKTTFFWTYGGFDRNVQIFRDSYETYQKRRHYRWKPGSLSLVPDLRGMSAFAVLNRQVVRWSCTDPAGDWLGPVGLGGDNVMEVTAARHADGRIRLFGLNVDAETAVSGLTTCVQDHPGGGFGAWQGISNPFPNKNPAESAALLQGDALGRPTAVLASDGAMHLVVRTADANLCLSTLRGSSWSSWTRLKGAFFTGGQCPVIGQDGTLEIYAPAMIEPTDDLTAPARPRILHWHQADPNAPLRLDPGFPAVQTASDPVAVLDSAGSMRVFYQLPDSAETGVLTRQPDGHWGSITRLSATGGSGTPAVAAAGPQAAGLLGTAVPTIGFGTGAFRQDTAGQFTQSWQDFSGFSQTPPAIATTDDGRFVLAQLGPDGKLRVSVQPRPGSTAAQPPLRIVGS